MKPAAARFQAALDALGLRRSVIELPVEARTSQQAADAVGVGVGQIAKSLVFMVDGAPVMVNPAYELIVPPATSKPSKNGE